jgi:hypothetical protein
MALTLGDIKTSREFFCNVLITIISYSTGMGFLGGKALLLFVTSNNSVAPYV